MTGLSDRLSPAVKKETRNVLYINLIGTAVMFVVFLALQLLFPDTFTGEGSCAFEYYTVILGGLCGAAISFLNFFIMALTVQKVASMEDRDAASKLMKTSYSRRLILQCLWIVAVIFAPCFQLFAGILPLLFPSYGIKIYGLFRKDLKSEKAEGINAPADTDAAEGTSATADADSADSIRVTADTDTAAEIGASAVCSVLDDPPHKVN